MDPPCLDAAVVKDADDVAIPVDVVAVAMDTSIFDSSIIFDGFIP